MGGLPFEMREEESDREPTKEEILDGLREALQEVKLAEEGKLKLKSLDEVLSEL